MRIQWDPERDWRLPPVVGVRAIQIGLSADAIKHYVDHWITHIEGVTPVARLLAAALESGIAPSGMPTESERPYPVDAATAAAITER